MNICDHRFTWWYRLYLRIRFRIRGRGLSDWHPIRAEGVADKCEFTPETIDYSPRTKTITSEEK